MRDIDSSDLAGSCAFRLLPGDDLTEAASSASVARVGAEGVLVSYRWSHPSDGEQQGALLVGGRAEDGRVEAAWFDTWHQQPGLMTLVGERDGSVTDLRGSYAPQWGWTIRLELRDAAEVDPAAAGAVVSLTMCNVVPESACDGEPGETPAMSPGPYEVMVAEWRR